MQRSINLFENKKWAGTLVGELGVVDTWQGVPMVKFEISRVSFFELDRNA